MIAEDVSVSQDRLRRKLGQVRALLAKAEDPAATPQEAEAYNRKAAELVAQYGIDAALLAESHPAADIVADRVIEVDAPYAMDKATLLNVVVEACRCRAVARRARGSGRKGLSMHLFGFCSDLERVELLYTSLLMQSAAGVASARVPEGETAAAFRRSWLAGFTTAVDRRLKSAESEARRRSDAAQRGEPSSSRSVDLVLADRQALVSRAIDAQYPRTKQGRSRSLSGSGYSDGHAAGRRADLGSDRGSVSRATSRAALGSR